MLLTTQRIRRVRAAERRGAISVLAAFLAVVVLAMVAFSVDTGYILSNKQELQRTADAAAMAACWEYGQKLSKGVAPAEAVAAGRAAAVQYAGSNQVAHLQTEINQNAGNSPSGDLVFGQIADLYDPNATVNTASLKDFNAVKIRIRRDESLNGEAPYFFAKIFGLTGQGLNAEATAGYYRNIRGVRPPAGGGNIDVLPYALDWETWKALLAGTAADQWRWNNDTKTITPGADGVLEVNLFPQGTGSPGNRGTVDIGSSNNSTADIARQIVHGISPKDLAYHGGSLEFNDERRTRPERRHGHQRRRQGRTDVDQRSAAIDPDFLEGGRSRQQRPVHDHPLGRHPDHGSQTDRGDEPKARHDSAVPDGALGGDPVGRVD